MTSSLTQKFVVLFTSILPFACAIAACDPAAKPEPMSPSTDSADVQDACTPDDCGSVPPVDPGACPGQNVTTVCGRQNGKCGYHVVCQPK